MKHLLRTSPRRPLSQDFSLVLHSFPYILYLSLFLECPPVSFCRCFRQLLNVLAHSYSSVLYSHKIWTRDITDIALCSNRTIQKLRTFHSLSPRRGSSRLNVYCRSLYTVIFPLSLSQLTSSTADRAHRATHQQGQEQRNESIKVSHRTREQMRYLGNRKPLCQLIPPCSTAYERSVR